MSVCRFCGVEVAMLAALALVAAYSAAPSGARAAPESQQQLSDVATAPATGEGDEPSPLERAQPLSDAERKKLLVRLATRATLHPQGTIQFIMSDLSNNQQRAEFLFAAQGESWLLRPASRFNPDVAKSSGVPHHGGLFTLVHGGRCFEGNELARAADREANPKLSTTAAEAGVAQVLPNTQLRVTYPESVAEARERETPYGFGTIYYASGRQFIAEKAAKARFTGVQRLFGQDVRVIEWDVAAKDAADAFPNGRNKFLTIGGVLRISVATARDDAVVRIEAVDRFGTAQFRADFWGFDAERVNFPRFARIAGLYAYEVTRVSRPGEPFPKDELALDIPAGIHVIDMRPKEQDAVHLPAVAQQQPGGPMAAIPVDPDRAYFSPNAEEYPFHSFETATAYPQGFPPKLLAELDRDVVPWETGGTWVSQDTAVQGLVGAAAGMGMVMTVAAEAGPARPPRLSFSQSWLAMPDGSVGVNPLLALDGGAGNPAKPATTVPKGALVYGGKHFHEWQQILLTDLEPETRVKALEALGTFAANGYAGETAEVVAQVFRTGTAPKAGDKVLIAACEALVKSGPAAVPVLETLLDGEQTRGQALGAIVELAHSVPAVLPVLLRFAKDSEVAHRPRALEALATWFLEAPGVQDLLVQALQDDKPSKVPVIRGLGNSKGPDEKVLGEKIAKLVSLVLADDDGGVRTFAAVTFAARAPGSPENARLLKEVVQGGSAGDRQNFINQLQSRMNSRAPLVPELAVPALIALLESQEPYAAGNARAASYIAVNLLGELAREQMAKTVLPILIDAVNLQLPTTNPGWHDVRMQMAGVDALARIGPAAGDAVPVLERWLDSETEFAPNELQQAGLESTKQWRSRLEAAIRKIEKK